jgi:hypothetical protein
MAITTLTATAQGQSTTATQYIGSIVVSVHGLKDGVVLLQRSRSGSDPWYTTDTITDDIEDNAYAPGDTLQDYYRLYVLTKPQSGDIELALGN